MAYEYGPNEGEISALLELRERYYAAKTEKNYVESDKLRIQLNNAGFVPPTYDGWSEVFESCNSRYARLSSRKDFDNYMSGKI